MKVMRLIVPIAGVVLLVTGVVLYANAAGSASFGWYAYAPLSDMTFTPSGPTAVALAFAGSGLVLVAGSAGFELGRRGGLAGRP